MNPRDEYILALLPDTTAGLARRARVSKSTIHRSLTRLDAAKKIRRVTRWAGALSHTFVYYRRETP